MKFDTQKTLPKSTDVQVRTCSHMNYKTSTPDLQRALIYLKLKDIGCDAESAMKFASKNVCMSDATLKHDGPANFRKLKVNRSHNRATMKGWISGGQKYDLGQGFANLVKDPDMRERELALSEKTLSKETEQKKAFRGRLTRMNDSLESTYGKWAFKGSGLSELSTMLETAKTDLKSFQAQREDIVQRNRFFKMKHSQSSVGVLPGIKQSESLVLNDSPPELGLDRYYSMKPSMNRNDSLKDIKGESTLIGDSPMRRQKMAEGRLDLIETLPRSPKLQTI